MNGCLNPKPAAEKARPPPAAPVDLAARSAEDERFRKWDSAAKRALGSICVGCERPAARAASKIASPRPADEEDIPLPAPRRIDSDDQ